MSPGMWALCLLLIGVTVLGTGVVASTEKKAVVCTSPDCLEDDSIGAVTLLQTQFTRPKNQTVQLTHPNNQTTKLARQNNATSHQGNAHRMPRRRGGNRRRWRVDPSLLSLMKRAARHHKAAPGESSSDRNGTSQDLAELLAMNGTMNGTSQDGAEPGHDELMQVDSGKAKKDKFFWWLIAHEIAPATWINMNPAPPPDPTHDAWHANCVRCLEYWESDVTRGSLNPALTIERQCEYYSKTDEVWPYSGCTDCMWFLTDYCTRRNTGCDETPPEAATPNSAEFECEGRCFDEVTCNAHPCCNYNEDSLECMADGIHDINETDCFKLRSQAHYSDKLELAGPGVQDPHAGPSPDENGFHFSGYWSWLDMPMTTISGKLIIPDREED